jgi:hypothetical protein
MVRIQKHLVSQPLILFQVPKQGGVNIPEIPCQELVTPRSKLLSRKPSKAKQPAGKLSNSTPIFHMTSAGSSSTSKKVMWQEEIYKEDSWIPRWSIYYTLPAEADVLKSVLDVLCWGHRSDLAMTSWNTLINISRVKPGNSSWGTPLLSPLKRKNNLADIALLEFKSLF